MRVRLLVAASGLALSTAVHAQGTHADSAAPAAAAAPAPTPVTVHGYVELGFHASTRASAGAITGRLYERTSGQFALQAAQLSVDRAIDPSRRTVGFHLDAVAGQNAPVLQSAGMSLGPNADVYQAFATVNLPTANGQGVQVKVGRMATFLGYELIETPLNPNQSIANQFVYVENFTQTGVSVEHRFSRVVDAQVRVFNGWDQVVDANTGLSTMARLGISPNAATSIALMGYTGAEQAGNARAQRRGAEVLATRVLGPVTLTGQADIGRETANAALPNPAAAAGWWALGGWAVWQARDGVSLAARGDYLADDQAARTGAAFGLTGPVDHRLASATLTATITAAPNLLVRPEVRLDRSNQRVFAGHGQQLTIGVGVVARF